MNEHAQTKIVYQYITIRRRRQVESIAVLGPSQSYSESLKTLIVPTIHQFVGEEEGGAAYR